MDIGRKDIKEIFINRYSEEEKLYAKKSLSLIKPKEDRGKIHFCHMTTEQMRTIIKYNATRFGWVYDEVNKFYKLLFDYVEFCKDIGLCKENNLNNISIQELQSIAIQKDDSWISREKFENIKKELVSYRDKLIFEAVYIGFGFNDINSLLSLTLENIDFKNKLIYLPDRIIKATDDFLFYAKKTSKEMTYKCLKSDGQISVKERDINNKAIIQGIYTERNGIAFSRLTKWYYVYTNGRVNITGGHISLWYDGITQDIADRAKILETHPRNILENSKIMEIIYNQHGVPKTLNSKQVINKNVKNCL